MGDRTYKRIEAYIRFHYLDIYYAVLVEHMENEELTSVMFGLTCGESLSLLREYARAMETYSKYTTYPKLTRTIHRVNCYDIKDVEITGEISSRLMKANMSFLMFPYGVFIDICNC